MPDRFPLHTEYYSDKSNALAYYAGLRCLGVPRLYTQVTEEEAGRFGLTVFGTQHTIRFSGREEDYAFAVEHGAAGISFEMPLSRSFLKLGHCHTLEAYDNPPGATQRQNPI